MSPLYLGVCLVIDNKQAIKQIASLCFSMFWIKIFSLNIIFINNVEEANKKKKKKLMKKYLIIGFMC